MPLPETNKAPRELGREEHLCVTSNWSLLPIIAEHQRWRLYSLGIQGLSHHVVPVQLYVSRPVLVRNDVGCRLNSQNVYILACDDGWKFSAEIGRPGLFIFEAPLCGWAA